MFFPRGVRISSSSKAPGYWVDIFVWYAEWYWAWYGIDDFPHSAPRPIVSFGTLTSLSGLPRVVVVLPRSIPSTQLVVIVSRASRWLSVSLRRPMYRNIYFEEYLEMTRLDEFFDFVLQSLTSFSCLVVVAMVLAMFGRISVLWGLWRLEGWDEFSL